MKKILEYIKSRKSELDNGLVRTPEDRDELYNRSGFKDPVLIQQAIQYGYKIALEDLENELKNKTS